MNPVDGWVRTHPHAAPWFRLLLTLTLPALVTFEGVVLAGRPSLPHAALWTSGILVRLSPVPWPAIPS
ncbi:hypothetical protein [Streptomyces sp. NRRL S-378]|uniref:hypothetical protein n=1 Tax=Streptomyces sp. NRRL S-378 TaxID=1463904 RepID=UPI0004C56A1C|nr:hypothetical protein [Streptomyces sp. NRRL S-378]